MSKSKKSEYEEKDADLDIRYFAPSYKRPQRSITQQYYPQVKLVVAEREVEEYEKHGNEVVACPDEVQGNICRVLNWILDKNQDADCVILTDDDIKAYGYWERQTDHTMDWKEFEEFCENATIMAYDLGVKMWGMNLMPDKGSYHEYHPFSMTSIILGPFTAHCKSELRYDERLSLKDDYDMAIQQLYNHHRVLRFNKYHYKAKQSENPGGMATYRNTKRERKQFKMLQQKWGSEVVRYDNGSKKEFDYNPIVKIPLEGV